jgi:hypothetical protein
MDTWYCTYWLYCTTMGLYSLVDIFASLCLYAWVVDGIMLYSHCIELFSNMVVFFHPGIILQVHIPADVRDVFQGPTLSFKMPSRIIIIQGLIPFSSS